VSRYLFLDSGPLGLVTQPRISAEVLAINRWLVDCLSIGDTVLVPRSFTSRYVANCFGRRRLLGLPDWMPSWRLNQTDIWS